MPTRTFTRASNEDYGNHGWLMDGIPFAGMIAGEGFTIAHDVLEHRPGDRGGMDDELRAFGAMWHVRAEGGWWQMYTQSRISNIDNMSGYFEMLAEYLRDGLTTLEEAPMTPSYRKPLEDTDAEEGLAKVIAAARKVLAGFDGVEGGELCDRALPWTRDGYRKAMRRYRGIQDWRRAELFQAVTVAAGEATKSLRGYGMEESEDVKMRLTWDAGRATCTWRTYIGRETLGRG